MEERSFLSDAPASLPDEHTAPGPGLQLQQNILGTYLHFKDARQAARDALSGESS